MSGMWVALLTVAVLIGAAAALRAGSDRPTAVPIDQVKAEVAARRAVLVDVREQREWDKGHLRDAVFVPLSQLSSWERDGISERDRSNLEKALPKGTVIYCHCAAGGRAVPAGEILGKLGYDARPSDRVTRP
ncbi:MAG: rhodanese-like domain-containing protein [Isosphaeraceae bacterium]